MASWYLGKVCQSQHRNTHTDHSLFSLQLSMWCQGVPPWLLLTGLFVCLCPGQSVSIELIDFSQSVAVTKTSQAPYNASSLAHLPLRGANGLRQHPLIRDTDTFFSPFQIKCFSVLAGNIDDLTIRLEFQKQQITFSVHVEAFWTNMNLAVSCYRKTGIDFSPNVKMSD